MQDREFRIWQTVNSVHTGVFVVEINHGEVVKRLLQRRRVDPLPWAERRKSPLIRRYWYVGMRANRDWNLYALFNTALCLKARLEAGDLIPPNWERKFIDGTRARNKKSNRRA